MRCIIDFAKIIALIAPFAFSGCASTKAKRDWEEARTRNTVVAYQEYLDQHSKRSINTYYARVYLNWLEAQQENTIEAYERFLKNHPHTEGHNLLVDGKTAPVEELEALQFQARDRMAWLQAKKHSTPKAYDEYLQNYPTGEFTEDAHELLWTKLQTRKRMQVSKAHTQNIIEDYGQYLAHHPQNPYAEEAHNILWDLVKEVDNIIAYERYLDHLPQGAHAQEARDILAMLRAWPETRRLDTIPAYERFLAEYSQGQQVEQASRRLESLRQDLPDWQKAQASNTIRGYDDFLRKHPASLYAERAKGKIVDLEVAKIMAGNPGKMPPAQNMGGAGDRKYSVVNVYNNTRYDLTILYSGPESFKAVFTPKEKSSIELMQGTYKVAATVDAANIRDYAGSQQSNGDNYEVECSIRSQYSSLPLPLNLPPYGSPKRSAQRPEFEPWPTKRSLPAHLK